MSKEYEAYQTWLAHCIEQGMVVRIVTQQRTPNGYITFTGDVKGMLKANEFHLTFREVEAINTPTQDELPLRNRIVNCFDGDVVVPMDAIDNLEKLIEAYKDNAVNEAKKTSYEEGKLDSIEHMVGWHKSEVNKLLDNIQAQQMAFRQEHGRLLLTYASRFHSIIEAERNNLNKSKEEK